LLLWHWLDGFRTFLEAHPAAQSKIPPIFEDLMGLELRKGSNLQLNPSFRFSPKPLELPFAIEKFASCHSHSASCNRARKG